MRWKISQGKEPRIDKGRKSQHKRKKKQNKRIEKLEKPQVQSERVKQKNG